ncbi:hypothetical protein ACT6P6_22040 [Priestia endophytica]
MEFDVNMTVNGSATEKKKHKLVDYQQVCAFLLPVTSIMLTRSEYDIHDFFKNDYVKLV